VEPAGFELRVRVPRHRMFRAPTGGPEVADYLLLRDWLRANADDRSRYETVKRELVRRPWRDVNDYAEAKGPVISA
jgi:GrpB-like predicted nucleotidyltransferase (UPF0157 family)